MSDGQDKASARILLYQLGDLPIGISHELRDQLLKDLEKPK